ncbi:MAG: 1-acyl-sn-glycerol-3-phosphate acyltransferase [Candidatus Omnitrophica bacterium]|nr:1-acyl-sn-glycerol-3-phosphate acyltransferase [Candidatus Omnitrophota bacterium]
MWYWLFRAIFILLFKIIYRIKVEGLENLPLKSNFIMVANHSSFLDPLVVMVSLPLKIHCIAMRSLYMIPALRWFLRANETLSDGSSSPKALELLIKNENVGLFPEGGISRDGNLREFRRGAALLAMRSGRPIVPAAIIGTFQAFPRSAKFPRFFLTLKLKIGKPIYLLKEFEEIIDDIYLQEGMFKVKNTVKEMLNAG